MVYAAGLYALGEISEGKTTEIADINRWDRREILTNAGVELRHGPQTVEDGRRNAELTEMTNEGVPTACYPSMSQLSPISLIPTISICSLLNCVTIKAVSEGLRAEMRTCVEILAPKF